MKMKSLNYLYVGFFILAFLSSHFVDTLWEQQDDAYITYSYARNIAHGDGFVFTHGAKPTYGTTTPLYTLLLALLCKLGLQPHITSPWVTSICHGFIAAFLFWFRKHFGNLLSGILAGLFWCLQFSSFFWSGGMETGLVMLLLLIIGWRLIIHKEGYDIPILLGLLLLTRPDTLIFVLLIFIYWYMDSPKNISKVLIRLGIMVLVYLPWALYAQITFGSIIPSSLKAKLIPVVDTHYMNYQDFSQYFFPIKNHNYILVTMLFFLCVGIYQTWRKSIPARYLIIWLPLYLLIMRLGKAPGFSWYYVPPIPFLLLFLALGLSYFISTQKSYLSKITLILLTLLLITVGIHSNYRIIRPLIIYPYSNVHKQLALRIKKISNQNDLIASFEVGNLAYWSDRKVLDLMGLTSPELQPLIAGHNHPAILNTYKPKYVLAVWNHDELKKDYTPMESYPFWAGPYILWKRNPDTL